MINKMISSTSLSISGGSSAEIYSDKSKDNYGLGENLAFHTNAQDNIAIGENAVNSSTSDALRNIGIGTNALTAITTGDDNIALGYGAGLKFTANTSNIAIGTNALDLADAGESYNIAIGHNALTNINHDGSDYNIAIGYNSIAGATTNAIVSCVSIGNNAMGTGVATEDGTIAIGASALAALAGGANNVAIGYQTMLEDTASANNTAVGYQAMVGGGGFTNTDNTFMGYTAGGGQWATALSSYNVGIGSSAMKGILNGALRNTAVGYSTLNALTQGTDNVGIGSSALNAITSGIGNVAIGAGAGDAFDTENYNVSIGYHSMGGSHSAANCVAIGPTALTGACTATGTVAIGNQALEAVTTGSGNLALGYNALKTHTLGSRNIAIGYGAMDDTDATHTDNVRASAITSGTTIVMDGANANLTSGQSVTGNNIPPNAYIASVTQTTDPATFELSVSVSGSGLTGGATLTFSGALASKDNVFIGYDAGGGTWGSHSSNYNTAIGSYAMNANLSSAGYNTGVGFDVLGALTGGDYNTAIGSHAADALTTGSTNTALGRHALGALTIGTGNIAIGYQAMDAADTGEEYNIAIGYDAMGAFDENGNAGDSNIAIGQSALLSGAVDGNTRYNIAIGHYAMDATGTNAQAGTIAVGYNALGALTSGAGNVAIGYTAMAENVTGHSNIAIGYEAMARTGGTNPSDSDNNIFIGRLSGGGDWSAGADAGNEYNVCIGNYTMDGTLSGAGYNTALGYNALGGVTSGDNNIAIGYNAGDGIAGTGNNTAVGVNALSGVAGADNTAIGFQAGLTLTGHSNTIAGANAMYTAAGVDKCVVIGYNALYTVNDDNADGTVAIGYEAGKLVATTVAGAATAANTLIGYSAGMSQANGSYGLTTGIQNTAVGHETLGGRGSSDSITGDSNTVMGYRSGAALEGSASLNTCMGKEAGDTITTGSGNTAIGATADTDATDSYQTAVGYNAVTQNNYETRIGFHGGFQFYSRYVTCDLGGAAENDPAHATPIGKIPRYAVITRATAVVTTLSSDANHTLKLILSSDATGSDNTALADPEEIIGAGATNSWTPSSGAAADINVASGAIIKTAYAAIPYDPQGTTNSGLATLDTTTADTYVYLAFADTAHTGGDGDPSTAPIVRVYIEYAGQD